MDLQLRDMSNFVESKFDDTFIEEMKVVRAPGVRDTHIHCVFFILDPSRLDANINASQGISNGIESSRIGKTPRIVGALDEDFDIQVMRTLSRQTTVIPVISKADTITTAHMSFLKQKVSSSLKKAGLDPLEALTFDAEESDDDRLDERDEDELSNEGSDSDAASPRSDDSEEIRTTSNMKRPITHQRQPSNLSIGDPTLESGYVPWSILSPDKYSLESKDGPVGRQFPWGFADPYDSNHCDFVKLKDAVFGEWRSELREASREVVSSTDNGDGSFILTFHSSTNVGEPIASIVEVGQQMDCHQDRDRAPVVSRSLFNPEFVETIFCTTASQQPKVVGGHQSRRIKILAAYSVMASHVIQKWLATRKKTVRLEKSATTGGRERRMVHVARSLEWGRARL